MLQAAEDHYRREQAATALGVKGARRVWASLNGADLTASWLSLVPRMVAVVSAAQLLAVRDADSYVGSALAEQGVTDSPVGAVQTSALVGIAADGRPLDSLLYSAVVDTKEAIGSGADVAQAMAMGGSTLDMLVATTVQDMGRAAVSVAMTARPTVTGFVRMLNPPSCSRCVVLAGRWYRWSSGFLRHERCDCRHVPAAEDVAGDLTTDPMTYFNSLTTAEQDKAFTAPGARAIRDGADLNQVVNARRGMRTATAYGRKVLVTTEGTTRRGFAGRRTGPLADGKSLRLMPESLYKLAGDDRDEALRLLTRFGYL